VQRVIRRDNLLANVRRQGAHLRAGSTSAFGNHPHVGDIRGRGLFRHRARRRPRDEACPCRRRSAAMRASRPRRSNGACCATRWAARSTVHRAITYCSHHPSPARWRTSKNWWTSWVQRSNRCCRADPPLRPGKGARLHPTPSAIPETPVLRSPPRAQERPIMRRTLASTATAALRGRPVRQPRGPGAAEVRHHRHRRRHRRLLRGRRRDLPAGQQGPREARHPLLGRIDRRLGVQHQHHQGRRARPRLRAERRAVQRHQGRRAVQGRRLSATCARCSRCTPSRSPWSRARKPASSPSPTSRASASTSATPAAARARRWRRCWRDGLEARRLLARLGAEGRRARPGAVRRQDRRLLLRASATRAPTSRTRRPPAARSWCR
jgi:hypothetical protein